MNFSQKLFDEMKRELKEKKNIIICVDDKQTARYDFPVNKEEEPIITATLRFGLDEFDFSDEVKEEFLKLGKETKQCRENAKRLIDLGFISTERWTYEEHELFQLTNDDADTFAGVDEDETGVQIFRCMTIDIDDLWIKLSHSEEVGRTMVALGFILEQLEKREKTIFICFSDWVLLGRKTN